MADTKTLAKQAAIAGLDFLVRNQCGDDMSADYGRFPFTYDCEAGKTTVYTTSWTTGVCVEALLAGHAFTGRAEYLEAAGRGVAYIKTLQQFCPLTPRVSGAMAENTPQSRSSHPRDGLTGAWAMLDYGEAAGDEDAIKRAKLFADWFVNIGMELGYPYWTAHFDSDDWTPYTFGSFQSGGAFFLYRLHAITGETKYRDAMLKILDFYNQHLLSDDGVITVIADRETLEPLDGTERAAFANEGWQIMHRYNDDFGALANLAASTLVPDGEYRQAAVRFLQRMLDTQRADGGFGPAEWSVPSAGGSVLMELYAARALGIDIGDADALDRVVNYLIGTQVRRDGDGADGAFLGFNGPNDYELSDTIANARTGGYAILALLRHAGAKDPYYFFEN